MSEYLPQSNAGLLAMEAAQGDADRKTHPTPCRVCGVAVPAEDAAYVADRPRWRVCGEHVGATLASVVSEVLGGEPVDGADVPNGWARSVLYVARTRRADIDATAPERAERHRKSWQHLQPGEVEGLREAVQSCRLAGLAAPHVGETGCAACGVREAVRWHETGLRFASGERAPVCGECEPTWARAGSPTWRDDERWCRFVAADAVGVRLPPALGLNLSGMRPFLLVATDADRAGHPERWGYAEAEVRRIRARLIGPRPDLARDDLGDDVLDQARTDWLAASERWERERPEPAAEPVHPLLA